MHMIRCEDGYNWKVLVHACSGQQQHAMCTNYPLWLVLITDSDCRNWQTGPYQTCALREGGLRSFMAVTFDIQLLSIMSLDHACHSRLGPDWLSVAAVMLVVGTVR